MSSENTAQTGHTESEIVEEWQEMNYEEIDEINDEIYGEDYVDENYILTLLHNHVKPYVQQRQDDLISLRIRFHNDPYIPGNVNDEQLIVYFLSMKCHVERTLSLLRNNYKFRATMPLMYSERSVIDAGFQEVWTILKIAVFPRKTKNRSQVCFLGLRDMDPNRFHLKEAFKLFLMFADVFYMMEGLSCAIILIIDVAGTTYGHMSKTNFRYFKAMMKYLQECMPYSFEAIYVINTTLPVQVLFRITRPFLTKEIINAISFYNGADLSGVLPAKCLPAELGGTAPESIDNYQERFRQKFERMQEFFDLEQNQRTLHCIQKGDSNVVYKKDIFNTR